MLIIYEYQYRLSTLLPVEHLTRYRPNAVTERFPGDMVHGKAGVFIPWNNTVQITVARAQDTVVRNLQQKGHVIRKRRAVPQNPLPQWRGIPLRPVTQISHRSGDLLTTRHTVTKQRKGTLRCFRINHRRWFILLLAFAVGS